MIILEEEKQTVGDIGCAQSLIDIEIDGTESGKVIKIKLNDCNEITVNGLRVLERDIIAANGKCRPILCTCLLSHPSQVLYMY